MILSTGNGLMNLGESLGMSFKPMSQVDNWVGPSVLLCRTGPENDDGQQTSCFVVPFSGGTSWFGSKCGHNGVNGTGQREPGF